MPVSRIARAGCNAGVARIWLKISGDALNRIQFTLSAETAIDDWVRGTARIVPFRAPLQLKQLQFHWGKPPPAAAPNILIRIARIYRRMQKIHRWVY
jgi:hypothetical protein